MKVAPTERGGAANHEGSGLSATSWCATCQVRYFISNLTHPHYWFIRRSTIPNSITSGCRPYP